MGDDASAGDETDRELRYGYFVLQAKAEVAGDAVEVGGVVENLTTGEKRVFRTAAEMARLLGEWAEDRGSR